MGRRPCCSKIGLNRGTWTALEDKILTSYVKVHGEGQWRNLPKRAGLKRCGKSCRLRWLNYLKPDIKRGNITPDEEDLILRLHRLLGNRWSLIAGRLPGRTDNEIKNYWHTILSKKANLPSPQANNKLAPSKKTEVLKPLPTKATRAVECPEHPLTNSNNPPPLRENFDLHHSEENPINLQDLELPDDLLLDFFDFESNGGDPFPANNCLSSMETFLMEECINNNFSDMESLEKFFNNEEWP